MTTVNFTIREGRLLQNPALKKAFELADGSYEMTIKKKDIRSLQQNRYYFGICVKMVQEALIEKGYDVSLEETHDWLKAKFNFLEIVNEQTGEVDRIPRSTTSLNKDEFARYIGKIQQFAAESLDIVIPDPGEQMMLEYQ